MTSRNHKWTYISSVCIGGIVGLLFLVCIFTMYGEPMFSDKPTFERLCNFVAFVSQPAFFLHANSFSAISIILNMFLFILYWMILGMAIASGLVWLYFFLSRKFKKIVNSSGKTGPMVAEN